VFVLWGCGQCFRRFESTRFIHLQVFTTSETSAALHVFTWCKHRNRIHVNKYKMAIIISFRNFIWLRVLSYVNDHAICIWYVWVWQVTCKTEGRSHIGQVFGNKALRKIFGFQNVQVNSSGQNITRNSWSACTLTCSLMELSPSWEAANCTAIQELLSVLWNPKVHHCVHKSQIDPIHIIPPHLSKIHLILSTHLRLGLPSGFTCTLNDAKWRRLPLST
jgi:hypothetical protein